MKKVIELLTLDEELDIMVMILSWVTVPGPPILIMIESLIHIMLQTYNYCNLYYNEY